MEKVLIIGYGKLGSHIYYALKKERLFKVTGIVKNSGSRTSEQSVKNADIIFITSQDSKIKDVVKTLSSKQYNLNKKFVFHTSGSLTSDELIPLAKKGASIASFHPVQTFESMAKKDSGRFKNIFIAIEGNNKAVIKAKQVSGRLGSKNIVIAKENKVYHHICCVIASNFMTTLMSQIEYIGSKKIQKNGFKNLSFFNIYKPLASQTLENIAAKGAVKSLTGPIERNDINTLENHLKTISSELLSMYLLMGIETVKLSLKKKSIDTKEAEKILKTFDKFIKINKIH